MLLREAYNWLWRGWVCVYVRVSSCVHECVLWSAIHIYRFKFCNVLLKTQPSFSSNLYHYNNCALCKTTAFWMKRYLTEIQKRHKSYFLKRLIQLASCKAAWSNVVGSLSNWNTALCLAVVIYLLYTSVLFSEKSNKDACL